MNESDFFYDLQIKKWSQMGYWGKMVSEEAESLLKVENFSSVSNF